MKKLKFEKFPNLKIENLKIEILKIQNMKIKNVENRKSEILKMGNPIFYHNFEPMFCH